MLNTSSKLHSHIFVLLVIVASCIVGFGLARAIYLEKIRTAAIILILPFVLSLPVVLSRVSRQTIISVLLLLFWLPIQVHFLNLLFSELYLFEFSIYCLLALSAVNSIVSRNNMFALVFEEAPMMAFLFFIGGAILTYAISYKAGIELVRMRLFCIFPMMLCLLFILTVRDEKDGDRYLWMIYISGSLLALLFNMADRSFSFMQATDYAAASSRLSMALKIPYLDPLQINPSVAGTIFGAIVIVGYYLWLFSVSVSKKLLVIVFSLILTTAIIFSQGRGGAGGAVWSIVLMSLLHFRKVPIRTHWGLVLTGLIFFTSLIIGGMWYFAEHSQFSDYNIRIVGMLNAPSSDANFITRLILWEEGFFTLLKNPLGIGFYGLPTTLSGDTWDVHNLYLYLWLCLGPIGFFGFWGIIYKFYKTFRESMNSHNDSLRGLSILGLGYILFICVAGMFMPLVFEPLTVVIIWAPLGIIFAACMREKNKSKVTLQSDSSPILGQIS